jgi:hypothetical protein
VDFTVGRFDGQALKQTQRLQQDVNGEKARR